MEEDAKCQCEMGNETVAHVLLRCPWWTDIKQAMEEAAERR